MTKPSFELEQQYPGNVAGVDEAGCGCWAGPVVAGAVILSPSIPVDILNKINDSKKLSPSKREDLFKVFQTLPDLIQIGIGTASVEEIDSLNIRKAAFLAMHRALSNLPLAPDMALVDGIGKPQLPCAYKTIIKGDQLSLSIGAASVVAKVTRDHMMTKLAQDYPVYGWEKNAGYGTAFHQDALAQHGITPHHRTTYAPIARLLSMTS
jgi:ribonuclease HII